MEPGLYCNQLDAEMVNYNHPSIQVPVNPNGLGVPINSSQTIPVNIINADQTTSNRKAKKAPRVRESRATKHKAYREMKKQELEDAKKLADTRLSKIQNLQELIGVKERKEEYLQRQVAERDALILEITRQHAERLATMERKHQQEIAQLKQQLAQEQQRYEAGIMISGQQVNVSTSLPEAELSFQTIAYTTAGKFAINGINNSVENDYDMGQVLKNDPFWGNAKEFSDISGN